MTKRKPREHDDAPSSLVDLAKRLDAAIHEAEMKKDAVDDANGALEAAKQEYDAAAGIVTGLATQMQALLRDILSLGGTIHVAP